MGAPCRMPSALRLIGTAGVGNPGFLHRMPSESLSCVIGRGVSIKSEEAKEMQTWEIFGSCQCPEAPVPLLTPYPSISAPHTMSLTFSRNGIEKTGSGNQQGKTLWGLLSLLRKLGLRREFSSFLGREQGTYFKPTGKNISQTNIIAHMY